MGVEEFIIDQFGVIGMIIFVIVGFATKVGYDVFKYNKLTTSVSKIDRMQDEGIAQIKKDMDNIKQSDTEMKENLDKVQSQINSLYESKGREKMLKMLSKDVIVIANDIINKNPLIPIELKELLDNFRDNFITMVERITDTGFEEQDTETLKHLFETYYNNSKRSISLDKLYVPKSKHDEFIDKMYKCVMENILLYFNTEYAVIKNLTNGVRLSKFKKICEITIGKIINGTLAVHSNLSK